MSIRKFFIAIFLPSLITAPAFAQASGLRNGLPPTSLDSFVYEAGAYKEFIYGDEGVYDIPPYFGFEKPSRINSGIFDVRDSGLTTGHGSLMPDAWGRDEFLGQEWSMSGAGGQASGQGFINGVPTQQDPTIVAQQPSAGDVLPNPGNNFPFHPGDPTTTSTGETPPAPTASKKEAPRPGGLPTKALQQGSGF